MLRLVSLYAPSACVNCDSHLLLPSPAAGLQSQETSATFSEHYAPLVGVATRQGGGAHLRKGVTGSRMLFTKSNGWDVLPPTGAMRH